MSDPMTPSEKREMLESLERLSVFRDGMSPESYEELENAESFEDLKAILLEVFEPSKESED